MKPEQQYDPSMTRFEWFARRHRRTLLRIRKFARGPLLCILVVGPLLWFGFFHHGASPAVTVRPPKRAVAKYEARRPHAVVAVRPTPTTRARHT